MSLTNIPVVDLARSERQAATIIDDACRHWGFFQVEGHGIAPEVLDAMRRAMRAFFTARRAEKRAVMRDDGNPWGFYDRELTKNTRDWKEIYDFGPGPRGTSVPRWPHIPGFKRAMVDYYRANERLAFRLLRIVAANLGMPGDALDGSFLPGHTSWVRLNYYPVCPNPEQPDGTGTPKAGHMGVNHHTDAGALTLLLQDDQPGLEVFRDGRWHLVDPRPDTLVVNIGDIVQVWSNDRYKAALHRVRANAQAERFSTPFFLCPSYESDSAPLPSTVDASHPPRYRPINWGRFYRARAAGDYADMGEEIQIQNFRIERGGRAA